MLFAAGWLVLAEGKLSDAWLGAMIVVVTACASYFALPPGSLSKLRLGPLCRFGVYFLAQSVMGGIDVAWRAMNPRAPLNRVLEAIELDLPQEGSRVLYAWTVSLLPGTASVRMDERSLVVHFLADSPAARTELKRLQNLVRQLHG